MWVNSECDEAEQIRILAHELAHIRCDHENREIPRSQHECDADSVACVVCESLGLDISSSTVEYLAGWTNPDEPEVLEEALATVHAVAKSIIGEIEDEAGQ